jgi:hypothetical protein
MQIKVKVKGIPRPGCYCHVINKAQKFNSDTSILVKYVNNLTRKGYGLANIVQSMRQVYFTQDIDNLLIQLVGPTSN